MSSVYNYLYNYFHELSNLHWFAKTIATVIIGIAVLTVAWIGHFLTRKILIKIVNQIASRTKTTWDDILVRNRFFMALAHLVPAFIIYYVAQDEDFFLSAFLLVAVRIYFIVIVISVINALLNSGLDIYNTTPYAHSRPIKGYIQLVKILAYSMSAILIVSILIKQDPTALLAGLGAIAAVLILIFKDTILGFVASIQLSANNMVKIGDWIQMPGHGADGSVIDITLNTVKVQNWDKTISTIPTYSLVAESFTNWKGMEEAGGRRIKRSIHIDMSSIKFCSIEMLQRFEKFELIKKYVQEKEQEIREYNKKHKVADEDLISGRRQTNVGVFRKYLEMYLRQHPKVHQNMTFLIRHLQPTEKGLPIEIYVFSKDIVWANYEAIQSDIFDHVLAVIPEFELKVYQAPSGSDLTKIVSQI
ncbi:MAG TPA: mechanosensitive ion channel domain-containing protein [Prolixibacteraceae bacterium]|nr:mechanosensitive ion channel domain-containing protein [Prolixibacteraceae bacterium]